METPALETRTNGQAAAAAAHKPFLTAAVLGAGTMGAQIAAHLANAGLQVYLLDIAPKEGGNNNAIVEKLFKAATKKKPDPFFTKKAAQRIKTGNFNDNFGWVGEVDWVIEAVVERLDIKHQVMKRIEVFLENGLLTPTMKAKRSTVRAAFEKDFDALYEEDNQPRKQHAGVAG